jgi:hypothetical protein
VIEVDIGQDRESGDSVLTLQDLLEEVRVMLLARRNRPLMSTRLPDASSC